MFIYCCLIEVYIYTVTLYSNMFIYYCLIEVYLYTVALWQKIFILLPYRSTSSCCCPIAIHLYNVALWKYIYLSTIALWQYIFILFADAVHIFKFYFIYFICIQYIKWDQMHYKQIFEHQSVQSVPIRGKKGVLLIYWSCIHLDVGGSLKHASFVR